MRAPYASRATRGWLWACPLLLLAASCQQTVTFVTDGGGGSGGASGTFCPMGPVALPPPTPEMPRVVVALDRSSAMTTGAFGNKTQLAAAQDALDVVVSKYDAVVKFAYVDFPSADFTCNQNYECCATQVKSTQDASDFHDKEHACDAFGAGCPDSNQRPMGAALESCKSFFGQGGGGKRYILLITDGEPTCNGGSASGTCPDEASIVSQLSYPGGVKTRLVVLDLPGDPCLTQLGQTGGTTNPPFYASATSPDELAQTLGDVVGTMAADACTLDLSGSPGGPSDFTLFLNQVAIPQGTDGWQYTDSSHTRIRLSDTVCPMFLQSPGDLALLGCGRTH